jgi:hypothetical protein
MTSNKAVTATFKKEEVPPPVGGFALPINLDIRSSDSLIPQIGLTYALSAIITATIILVRRRKYTLRREH